MELPVYNYYLGLSLSLIFGQGTVTSEGVTVPGSGSDYYVKHYISGKADKLYFDSSIKAGKSCIYFLDKSGKKISKIALSGNKPSIIIPSNTDSFVLLLANEKEQLHVDKIKLNYAFVYSLHAITPHYKKLSKKYAKENNQVFFRETLDGKINLYGEDYKLVGDADIETKFVFIIDKLIDKDWKQYFIGTFSKTDCKLDRFKKQCELKISAIDQYSEVLSKYENTYDLIKLAPRRTALSLNKRPLIQVYIKGGNTVSHFIGGTYWEDDVNSVIDDHKQLVNNFYFSLVTNFNEMRVGGPSSPELPSQFSGANGVYANSTGRKLKLVKVASRNDLFTGQYAKPEIYNVSSGSKSQSFEMREDIPYFVYNTYAFHLIDKDGATILGISDYIFRVPDSNNINIEGFEKIVMTNPKSQFKFDIDNIFLQGAYARLLCDVDSVEGLSTYPLPADDFVQDNRNYKRCIGVKGGLCNVYISTETVEEPTKYGQNDLGEYFTDNIAAAEAGIQKLYPVCRSAWVNASIWFEYSPVYFTAEANYRKKYTIYDALSIADVIKVLLKQIDPTLTHEATPEYSNFLYANNQVISLQKFWVFIIQKSNILKGEYDQAAQKAEITLKDLADMLRDCFRCYWYIEDNKFKIEHIVYFMLGHSYSSNRQPQINLTTEKDRFNLLSGEYFQGEVEYDKTDLASRYEFNWMDNCTDLFAGISLTVESNYIQKDKSEEINISKFSSDIDHMLFEPNSYSKDGFALVCATINERGWFEVPIVKVELIDENGKEYEAISQNWYASWLYLVNAYMYDMPAKKVSTNYGPSKLFVKGVKQCMQHNISFSTENDPDLFKTITTSIGEGVIDEVSIDLNMRIAKAKLVYKPS